MVDDDRQVCNSLALLLRGEGHQVTCVYQGSQALTSALAQDFDLMFCDVTLPDLGGTELIRAVKAQAPQLPVVVLSGGDPDVWEKPCEDAGAALFVAKPATRETILREVALVQRARLGLHVILVDTDPIHRTRLTKTMEAMGCVIAPYPSAAAALESPGAPVDSKGNGSLWVVDASDPDIMPLLKTIKAGSATVFAFSSSPTPKQEEDLMRAGAALFLSKPINLDTLLTQASFLAR